MFGGPAAPVGLRGVDGLSIFSSKSATLGRLSVLGRRRYIDANVLSKLSKVLSNQHEKEPQNASYEL
jgi:hypothetical protein